MRNYILLSFLLLISLPLHFYNISWGQPYFFHPDERNVASSISQLTFPTNMNPHFFAYGSLPIYTIYFLGVISHIFSNSHSFIVSFEQAIILGRIISAFLSTCTIFILFFLGKRLHSQEVGIFAASLGVFSIGLTQYAHFATFEMWLTCFSILLTYICITYLINPSKSSLLLIAILLGILISIKVSSLVFFLPVFITLCLSQYRKKISRIKKILSLFIHFIFIVCFSLLFLFISNPYILIDTSSFLDSMQYESSVATGYLPVFYTQGFNNTIPIYYQLISIYPFILNPLATLIFLFSFLYLGWKTVNNSDEKLFIFHFFFLSIFLSQTTLFVKWTRYLIPTLPYIYIMIAYMCLDVHHLAKIKKNKNLIIAIKTVMIVLTIVSLFYSTLFLYEAYIKPDTRVQAYDWAKRNISSDKKILSEIYDLGIVPFNESFPNITLFNFYDLETNDQLPNKLTNEIKHIDYIILPSQRIIKNRMLHPKTFPKGNKFYSHLFNTKNYEKIYETPCNTICQIIYYGHPVFNLEETTTVFDRPTIYIFKKL